MQWWQSGIVYQIYARSFQDSDGDGTGDLHGIAARLPQLVWLGVDAVWVTPVYPSPMADFGYDVADYCGVDPLFGTLADLDALLAEAHRLGLRVIMDLVPNHSSDRHPWFQSSRDAAGPHADWYIWHPQAENGGPPNNWTANFGGPAWTWDDRRGAYYYHSFLPQQPDLNWRNPGVVAAMHDVMRFWLARGVDGFRVDVMWMMIKDDRFRDNPENPAWRPGQPSNDRLVPLYNTDRPEVHRIVAGLRAVLDEYEGRVLIGELYLPTPRLVTYYGRGDEAHLPFNFQLLLLQDWSAPALATLICDYEAALPPGAWPNWVLGNHDRPRIASRVGPAQARVAAMLLLTLRGTPTLYMGEELGLQDTPIPPDAIRDPAELREPGLGLGRDPERTPYPWTAAPGAGFTTGTPWLPIGPATPHDAQANDPASMLSLHRRLIALRREHPALVEGAIANVIATGPVLSYERHRGADRLRIVLNTSDAIAAIPAEGTLLATTDPSRDGQAVADRVLDTGLTLAPDEGLILRLHR